MVTHDYERGTIRGLSRAVLDELRRTGSLPPDALTPNASQLWAAVASQRTPLFAGRRGVVALLSEDASWQQDKLEAEFNARMTQYSADASKCSNGWYRLIAEAIAYAYAKAVCEEEFGGELVTFEFDGETCRITRCECKMDGWRPPGGIDKPSPIPWGPEIWEEEHWGDDGWEF